jgi:hypothetical protein
VSKLIYEFAVSVVRSMPFVTVRVDVIGDWLANGWHARDGLAFGPDGCDVALGINRGDAQIREAKNEFIRCSDF